MRFHIKDSKTDKIIKETENIDFSNMNINEYLDLVIDHKGYIHKKYSRLCEYFGDVPDDIQNKFKSNPSECYIIENLKTHDSNLLVRKIQEKFPEFDINDISVYNENKIKYVRLYISYKGTSKDKVCDFINSKVLQNLLDFFGYIKSSVTDDKYLMGNIGTELCLEPVQTEYADRKFIHDVCYDKLYHITTSENAEKIDKSGLRVRAGNDYRDFPERVYLFAVPPNGKFNIKRDEFKNAAIYFTNTPAGMTDNDINLTIYEVNCDDLILYKDVTSIDSGIGFDCFFTYETIPTKYIKKIWSGTKENLIYN